MAEISEKELAERKIRKRPGDQVTHFIMRISVVQKKHLIEMAEAKDMNMSEFMVWLLGLSWENYKENQGE
ncbi:MAG: hypothetical protein ACKVKR_01055 [Pseudomonadales bacterium]|tara:strand:- start:1649 stop:1858 length:210 start_codon:yes stop_codon:yes gene_type:complete